MNNTKYDYVVFVGRMQPPHLAHIEIIVRALKQSKKVIVLFGSDDQPRTIENPWTATERGEMVKACFNDEVYKDRILTAGIEDYTSNQHWASAVQETVAKLINNDILKSKCEDNKVIGAGAERIALIGHKKDMTSFYLDMFPQWASIEVENIDDIHATDIRKMMFENDEIDTSHPIPKSIVDYLNAFMNSNAYSILKEEYDFIQNYKKRWEVAPYAPTFNTVDAVVVQSGHVLLVRRRAAPGKNLWALPGGFINPNERIRDAVVRELREETKIKVPESLLRSKAEDQEPKVFDNPKRSLRGRTITFAFGFELPPGPLPRVKGSDDADKAKWVPLSVVEKMRNQLFEDHYYIIKHFTS